MRAPQRPNPVTPRKTPLRYVFGSRPFMLVQDADGRDHIVPQPKGNTYKVDGVRVDHKGNPRIGKAAKKALKRARVRKLKEKIDE